MVKKIIDEDASGIPTKDIIEKKADLE